MGLFPAGIHETNEKVNQNCSSLANTSNAGYYCMMRIKNNGWVIPADLWKIKCKIKFYKFRYFIFSYLHCFFTFCKAILKNRFFVLLLVH